MRDPNSEEQATLLKEALFAGNKIFAIKFYREQTGAGLKEAKDAVEMLETELRAASPGRFTKPPAAVGCSRAVLVLIGIGVLVLLLRIRW